jgi:2-keto-4-pentenoate hydratase
MTDTEHRDPVGKAGKLTPHSADSFLYGVRLSEEQVQSAANLLLAARAGRIKLPQLPGELTPQNTVDIQRIIAAVSADIDRPVRGWKIYTVYKNQNPPFWCPIYDVFPNGARLPLELAPDRLVEPEIIFRADRDFRVRDCNYSLTEVLEGVTAHVGFEILAPRYRGELTLGERPVYGSLADHIANGCVVVGDSIPEWRSIDFEDVTLRVSDDGVEQFSLIGGHPFDNPFLPIVVLVNRVRRKADIKANDVLLSASSASFFTGGINTVIRAVYEGLGEVTATFAD